jgi:hypothetical protein
MTQGLPCASPLSISFVQDLQNEEEQHTFVTINRHNEFYSCCTSMLSSHVHINQESLLPIPFCVPIQDLDEPNLPYSPVPKNNLKITISRNDETRSTVCLSTKVLPFYPGLRNEDEQHTFVRINKSSEIHPCATGQVSCSVFKHRINRRVSRSSMLCRERKNRELVP